MDFTRAENQDISQLIDLRIAYLEEDLGAMAPDIKDTVKTELNSYFNWHLGSDLFVYTAKDEDEIVSTAFLLVVEKPASPSFLTGKTGLVLSVYTKPAFRKQGLAKRLMEMLLSDGNNLKLSYIDLQATKDGFPLYKKIGFKTKESEYTPMRYQF